MINNILKTFSNELIFGLRPAGYFIKSLSWLFAVIAVSTVAGFVPAFFSFLYLPITMICLLYVIVDKGQRVNFLYVIMYMLFALSALLSTEPIFNSNIRFLLFLAITLLSSGCISSERARLFRSLVLRNLIILLAILTIGSFFSYFFGINFMRVQSIDVTKAGVFGGLYTHSMLLGPLSVLVALAFMNAYIVSRNVIYMIFFFISSAAVIMSSSRASVFSLCGSILFLLLCTKSGGHARSRLIGLLLIATIVAIPTIDKFSSGLLEKQQSNVEAGGTLNSRESKWNNRLQEFKSHPFFGIGFCAVDINNTDDYTEFGNVEPGSTHLSVLSMTGLLGFITYLLVISQAVISSIHVNNPTVRFRLSILIAMLIHAMFEGYALYAGGLLCFVYWLSVGLCADIKMMRIYNS